MDKKNIAAIVILGIIVLLIGYNYLIVSSYNKSASTQRESIMSCDVDSDCEVKRYYYNRCDMMFEGCFSKNEAPLDDLKSYTPFELTLCVVIFPDSCSCVANKCVDARLINQNL